MTAPPPRVDDPSILDTDYLWRRVIRRWIKRVDDDHVRITSAAFKDGSARHELSVDLAKLTNYQSVFDADARTECIAQITAGTPRAHRHIVASDPKDFNPAHALICHLPLGSKTPDPAARAMASSAVMLDVAGEQITNMPGDFPGR